MQKINFINLLNKEPNEFIQNTSSWCWVVCAKIVGFEYLRNNFVIYDYSKRLQQYEEIDEVYIKFGIPLNINNFRKEYTGIFEGLDTVDAWQVSIVANVFNDKIVKNHLATDEDKENALKYVITGSIYGDIDVKTLGSYYSNENLLGKYNTLIVEILNKNKYIIGNYVIEDIGIAHSIVLEYLGEHKISLYDPWDGYETTILLEQVFITGFSTNRGYGHIQWIQYIDYYN